MATVRTPSGYAGRFNMPTALAAHQIEQIDFIGRQQQLWRPLGGIAVWRPGNSAELVHTFNRIPLHRHRPWMVTFEDNLPRGPGPVPGRFGSMLRHRLVADSCVRIIAMSRWALGLFIDQHKTWSRLPEVLDKTEVLYPALPRRTQSPKTYEPGSTFRAVFVGTDWATKGAPVAGRLARLAQQRGLPVEVHVVSSLRFGYADSPQREVYEADRRLITDGPVHHHGSLPNDAVHELLERSHLLLLPSLGDTFGYSVLEGFAHGLPALVSNTNALPELVRDGVNGCVVKLETNSLNTWTDLKRGWEYTDAAYSTMAEQAATSVESIVNGEVEYERLSAAALQQWAEHHDPTNRDAHLDAIYSSAARR